MTRKRFDEKDTPFGSWLRSNPQLDSAFGFDGENLDYIWHDYKRGYIMLIEEKRYSGRSSYAQEDTHSLVDQAMQFACERMVFKRINKARPTRIKYFGYHRLVFENTSPLDGWIQWDGRRVTADELTSILRFETIGAHEH